MIENADRMGMNDWQKQALRAEAALYANLGRLVDSGVPITPSPPPVDRKIIDQMEAALDRWMAHYPELEQQELDAAQRAEVQRSKEAVAVLRQYIASYPVVKQ
ncbi:MAG: hypothetical protein E6H90_15055 [Chloroflexi bacterium]|nr:MAG: hypothetical protein E6H90_15055 [Chloroflexota bacterium]